MTETIAQGAANQAGARINPDAYAEAGDFLPLNGIDHVEFWVGNARQASAYYRALWGFTPIAYAGLDVGPEALDRGAGGTETRGQGRHVGRFGWLRHGASVAPRA